MAGNWETENAPSMAQTAADVQQGLTETGSAVDRSQADAGRFIREQGGPAGHAPVGGYQSPGGSQGQSDARDAF
jgi:hypothetical protein